MITYRIKASFILLVCFVCLIQNAAGNDVIRLDATNFATLTSEGRWFVKFFAPWCGHCQQLEPVWNTVAAKTNFDDVKIAEVDCTANALLCGRQKIVGYPMLKWYENGEVKEYKGARDSQAILDWIAGGAKPFGTNPNPNPTGSQEEPVQLTEENFDQVLEGLWMVNFYASWCAHSKKFEPIWRDLAQHAQGYKVASIDVGTAYQLSKQYEVHGTPTVLFFKNGYHFRVSGPRSVDFLDRFARSEGLGQPFDPYAKKEEKKEPAFSNVVDLTEDFDKAMVGNQMFTLFYAPWCGHCKKVHPVWEELANNYVGKPVTIAKVDGTRNHAVMERYKVRGYPTLLYTDSRGNEYQYSGARDFESLDKYLTEMMKQNPQ